MDINELKAAHPVIAAALVAEGHALGAKEERERVKAHMTYGTSSGDMKTAKAAIEDGSELTADIIAKYMTAGMNKNDMNARSDDDESAGAAADGAAADGVVETDAEKVATILEAKLGVKP